MPQNVNYILQKKKKKWWKHIQTIQWIDADACVYYIIFKVRCFKILLQKQTLQDGSQIIEKGFNFAIQINFNFFFY